MKSWSPKKTEMYELVNDILLSLGHTPILASSGMALKRS
jgi:hypothetical protein